MHRRHEERVATSSFKLPHPKYFDDETLTKPTTDTLNEMAESLLPTASVTIKGISTTKDNHGINHRFAKQTVESLLPTLSCQTILLPA